MTNNKVSVIIPVFNSEEYIAECLKSIMTQTYDNLEVVVVNDGSTDGTIETIKKWAQEDERIIVLDINHKGVSHARNAGLEAATGEYVTFIDSDDYVATDYIEKLVFGIIGSDISIGGYETWNIKRNERTSHQAEPGIYTIEELSRNMNKYYDVLGYVGWKLYRRNILEKHRIRFPDNMKYGEDTIFFLNALKYVDRIAVARSSGYIYRVGYRKIGPEYKENEIEKHASLINQLGSLYKDTEQKSDIIYRNALLDISFRWQIMHLWEIGMMVCYQEKGHSRNQIFFNVVHEGEMKNRKLYFHKVSIKERIILYAIRLNTILPVLVIVRTFGKLKKWDKYAKGIQ